MAERSRMFSEHWYRVAGQRVALRATVRARRQVYRGEVWRVLYDPFGHRFFRVRPSAYDFVARLDGVRTVEEAWRSTLTCAPDEAPGQEEVIRLLAQLYHANLLRLDLPPDAEKFFERYRKRTQQEQRAIWLNIMFARFPLLDPDAWLNRMGLYGRAIFSRIGALVWLAAVLGAVKVGIDHAAQLVEQGQGVLAPGNLVLLYLGLVVVKALHEFGHAFACKRFGGEVHTMGIMLMIFTPIPYVDVTSSWAFRPRRERMLVSAAGMIVEIFAAAVATFVWAGTGPGTLNALAYNMMFVASASTLLFNGNPLLRYDGYYLLADLLDIPNLYTNAQQQLRYLAERYLLGRRTAHSPAATRREALWLASYGILSGVYRVFVFSLIVLFVGQRFLLLGVLMAAVCVFSWVVVPAGRLMHYLLGDPALARNRGRALGVSAAIVAALAALLGLLPLPASFSAPGLLQAREFAEVTGRVDGSLAALSASSGATVTSATVLVTIEDPEQPYEWAAETAARHHALAQQRRALREATADLEPIRQRLALIDRRLERLIDRRAQLDVRAPIEGTWVAGPVNDFLGAWVERGTALGYVVDQRGFEFRAIVSQAEADRLFDAGIRGARVRLRGAAGVPLTAERWHVVPAQQQNLPSAALGWRGGGDVAVAQTDSEGVRAAETFFELRAEVAGRPGVELLHGRTGRIRFELAPEPAWRQAVRRLQQLLQKRGGR